MGIGSGSVRLMTAAIATALAGCASSPPPRTATQPLQPVAGETQEVIAERAFLFVAVYQFELAGHRYTLGHASDAQQRETYSELVFIDGQFACARERPMETLADLDSELTEWERVAEPGGLEHLAEQLRNACESAQPVSPRMAVEGYGVPPLGDQAASGTSEGPASSPSEAGVAAAVVAHGVNLALVDPRLLLIGPLVLLTVGISNLVEKTLPAKAAEQREAEWRSATTIEEVMKLLGDPVAEFSLPNVNTQVMAYRLGDVHPYYVGMSGGKPIWIHKEYPWLHSLADQAIEEGKKKP